ncbi:MAG: SDR family NAD(P)-dependent oxidoreductase [Wenzhouxiangellaceae bacterium]
MTTASGQVALVTGAAGALGMPLVRRLMAAGIDCVVLDRQRRALERLHDELGAGGRAPLLVPMDLTGAGPEDHADLAAALEREFGRLDLLIHAAAEFDALSPIEHHDPMSWVRIMQAGITGPFLLTRALLGLMRATPGSRVVWISDDPAHKRRAYWGAYGVAQAGREALAEILAAESVTRGPGVISFDPGPFHSPLRSRAWPMENPLDLPTAEEAADAVLQRLGLGGPAQ